MRTRIAARWWIGGAAVVAVAVVVTVLCVIYLRDRTDHGCGQVRAMIAYNKSQDRVFASQSDVEQGKEPSVADYQAWADRMHQFAAQVTDPALAPQAQHLADLAGQTAAVVAQARSERDTDPLAPPAWFKPYAALDAQFRQQIDALNRACPA